MRETRDAYTVKQLSDLAGVSIRTLHYYDQIGLLRPRSYGENGYRYYGDDDLLRLQEILFFRELDFPLADIQALLDKPGFDLLEALQIHRQTLSGRVERLQRLIQTVDRTIGHLTGEIEVSDKDLYQGFDEEKQKEYEQYAREHWDAQLVDQSVRRWGSYNKAEKQRILEEGKTIHQAIAANMSKGPRSPEVQAWIARHYASINHFYDCTLEIYEGLGHLYVENEEFTVTYEKIAPGMAQFMQQAIEYFVEEQRKI